ncbi:MAG: hypothetical protein M3Y23_00505 [Actinomycetota bacterium]|nr:hypothetical protein [Actinomycetota bacterium]
MAEPTRVLTFTGTRDQFFDWLNTVRPVFPCSTSADLVANHVYEWEITASIARHPAGKGLGRGN